MRAAVVFIILIALLSCISLLSGPATSWQEIQDTVFGEKSALDFLRANSGLIDLRLVHVLLSICVGFALACGGRAMQLYLQNPLADPHMTGLSAGSTTAVLLTVLFFPNFANSYFFDSVPAIWMSACLGALASLVVLNFLLRATLRGWGVASLALVGLLVNAVCAAGLMVIFARLSPAALGQVQNWTLGSIQSHSLSAVAILLPLLIVSGIVLIRLDSSLRILSFGSEFAKSQNVNVVGVRRLLLFSLMVLCATTVCAAGSVGFVGVLVPHFTRRFFSSDAFVNVRPWLNGLAGAALVLVADLCSRTLTSPLELPVGVYTALLALPFLLLVLVRRRGFK